MMKILLLFYMCHFAMGLTHCYKTTVFFTFITRMHGVRSHDQSIWKNGKFDPPPVNTKWLKIFKRRPVQTSLS